MANDFHSRAHESDSNLDSSADCETDVGIVQYIHAVHHPSQPLVSKLLQMLDSGQQDLERILDNYEALDRLLCSFFHYKLSDIRQFSTDKRSKIEVQQLRDQIFEKSKSKSGLGKRPRESDSNQPPDSKRTPVDPIDLLDPYDFNSIRDDELGDGLFREPNGDSNLGQDSVSDLISEESSSASYVEHLKDRENPASDGCVEALSRSENQCVTRLTALRTNIGKLLPNPGEQKHRQWNSGELSMMQQILRVTNADKFTLEKYLRATIGLKALTTLQTTGSKPDRDFILASMRSEASLTKDAFANSVLSLFTHASQIPIEAKGASQFVNLKIYLLFEAQGKATILEDSSAYNNWALKGRPEPDPVNRAVRYCKDKVLPYILGGKMAEFKKGKISLPDRLRQGKKILRMVETCSFGIFSVSDKDMKAVGMGDRHLKESSEKVLDAWLAVLSKNEATIRGLELRQEEALMKIILDADLGIALQAPVTILPQSFDFGAHYA